MRGCSVYVRHTLMITIDSSIMMCKPACHMFYTHSATCCADWAHSLVCKSLPSIFTRNHSDVFRSLGGTGNEAKRIQMIHGRWRVSISIGGKTQCGPCRGTQLEAQADLDAVRTGSTPEQRQELLDALRQAAAARNQQVSPQQPQSRAIKRPASVMPPKKASRSEKRRNRCREGPRTSNGNSTIIAGGPHHE